MRKSLIIVMIMMMMILELSQCCLETEKIGLLEIKEKLPFYSEFVSSWGSDSDCCSWKGVKCNSSTGHVTLLDHCYMYSDSEWYLNASLFLPFPHLNRLFLVENGIAGCIQNEGFERLSSTLTNLEILRLSDNNLNNSILQSLSAFRSLKSLYLGGNRLNGTVNNKISDLHGLPNLQELSLIGNKITEFVLSKDYRGPSNLSTLYLDSMRVNSLNLQSAKLPNIKTLYLRKNNFQGQTLPEEPLYDYKSKVEEIWLDNSSIDEKSLGSLSRAFPSLKLLYMRQLTSGTLAVGEGSNFGSLEHLYLNDSTLDNKWLQRIGPMTSLKTLSMPNCRLSGDIPASQGLCLLKHLQELDMSHNDLNGNLPWCLGNLTSLEMLDLSFNQLSGNLPPPAANWASLRELYLSSNHFSGNLPFALANLTSLEMLDLTQNQFSGNMSSSHFQTLLSLQYLRLSDNLLQIPISLTPLFNLSQLTLLNVHNNTIYADTHDHNLKPKFQLEYLDLTGYGDGVEIPKFLYHQRNLQRVYISKINMRGMFPYWLLENNTRLNILDLSNNFLSGPLLLPNKPHLNLTILDISDNSFTGSIHSQIGECFPSLGSLYMSRNEFKGSIAHSLCKITNLYILEISQNKFSGRIPKCVGNMTNLQVLDLSNNSISGCLSNFGPSLFIVKLSQNRLQGSWNHAFYNCTQLSVLDLSHNNFSGNIPSWIGNLSYLKYLVLGHNNLQGEIPIELCKMEQLSFLDLSHNRISGHMLSCLNFSSYLDIVGSEILVEFTVKGNTYSYKVSSYISGIDVSCNSLGGQIPPQIGDLGSIKVLNFSHNCLTGRIPPTFSNLKDIESLDLSYNNLQGTIPHQLTQLTFIEVFNVSYNNLSGQTPDKVKQFATFDERSYKGNPFLCGWPLPKSCNEVDSPPSSAYDEESSDSLIDMEAFYWSFGIAYGMVLMSIVAVLCINPHWRRVWFYYVQISIDNSYYFLIDNVPFLSRFRFPKFCRRIYRCIRD